MKAPKNNSKKSRSKRSSALLQARQSFTTPTALAVMTILALVGIFVVVKLFAVSYKSLEPESSAPNNLVATDSTASAGKYLRFATVNPGFSVTMTAPTGGTLTGTVSLRASYSGNVQNVEFFAGSTLIGTGSLSDGVASASFNSATTPNGANVLHAEAWDVAAGLPNATQHATSANVSVTFQNIVANPTPTTPPPPPSASGNPSPVGIGGNWNLIFRDEFNGTSLDRSRWEPSWYNSESPVNNVPTRPWNVAVTSGNLVLTLSGPQDGAAVTTNPTYGNAGAGFEFTYGIAEARVYFPGNGRQIYNWPAWWTNSRNWPTTGEFDIAEGLGELTVNYWATLNGQAHGFNGPAPAGTWSNAYHVYSVHRKPGVANFYWDGQLVHTTTTYDGGAPHFLMFNAGCFNSSQPNIGKGCGPNDSHVYGADSQVKVDYVRVWQ